MVQPSYDVLERKRRKALCKITRQDGAEQYKLFKTKKCKSNLKLKNMGQDWERRTTQQLDRHFIENSRD